MVLRMNVQFIINMKYIEEFHIGIYIIIYNILFVSLGVLIQH